MAKSNVVKKTKNYIESLKALSNIIASKQGVSMDQIEYFVDKYEIDNNIMKRVLSYFIGYPNIQKYCNTYLNNRFTFNSWNTKDLLLSLIYIVNINRLNSKDKFHYLKAADMKDDTRNSIKKLLKQYFDEMEDCYYNDIELTYLYKLFNLGVIQEQELAKIDNTMNNKQTVKLNKVEVISQSLFNMENQLPEWSDEIRNFISFMNSEKNSNCQNCPLFSRPMVVLDTNCKKFEMVDIMFIGLNPSREDANENRPFIDDSGIEIRKIVSQLSKDTKWVLTNAIMCQTNNKNEMEKLAGNVQCIKDNCAGFLRNILSNFPSKLFIPIGNEALEMFNVTTETISTASGKLYDWNGYNIIPLIHPSSILRSRAKFQGIFTNSVKSILNYTPKSNNIKIDNKPKQETNYSYNKANIDLIPSDNIITHVDKSLTFFDVRELTNQQILFIYIDPNGIKKYLLQDYKFEFYVKSNTWDTSLLIEDSPNFKVSVDGSKRYLITKKVREQLDHIKRS